MNQNCSVDRTAAGPPFPLLLLWGQLLPQFDLVAVGIVDPREPAIVCVLALGIDLDAFFLQPFKQRIQVVHNVVHHERLARLEVLGASREQGPDGHMLVLGVVFLSPRHHDAPAFIRESEMLAVPLTHLLLIRGLEEYSTDPQDSPSLARHCRSYLRACRICRGARRLLRGANRQQKYSQSGQNGKKGHWRAQHARILAPILVSVPEAPIHKNRPALRSFRSFQGSALSPTSRQWGAIAGAGRR